MESLDFKKRIYMKKIILILLLLISFRSIGQLPYSWTSGVNPAWISAGGGANALNWQVGCSVVTTNCVGNYPNNLNTTYTSPTIDASCVSAPNINITFTASGNAEFGYDFLFVFYSLDNGITWVNPYGVNVGWTGNFGISTTIPPITVPTSSTFKFRFNFVSDFSVVSSGYKLLGFNIVCNTPLPINLISFTGEQILCNKNILTWVTATETNNDYFDVESTIDFTTWKNIGSIDGAGNSTSIKVYNFVDYNPQASINYYRIKQVDYNGLYSYSDIIFVDNGCISNLKIYKVVNLLGQEISQDYGGPRLIYYTNGTVTKKMGN